MNTDRKHTPIAAQLSCSPSTDQSIFKIQSLRSGSILRFPLRINCDKYQEYSACEEGGIELPLPGSIPAS